MKRLLSFWLVLCFAGPLYANEINHVSSAKYIWEKDKKSPIGFRLTLGYQFDHHGARINREYQTLERLLSSHLVEDPRQASNLFKITWCARALERIGDHSVNICEYVVYLVKGRDIRHTSMDKVRSELQHHD